MYGKNGPLNVNTQYLSLEMSFGLKCSFAVLFDSVKYAVPPCVVSSHITNRNALPIIMSGVPE